MKWGAILAALVLTGATPAIAALAPADLGGVGVTPPPGARLPSGRYVDQFGRPAGIESAKVPTILIFADYTCAHLCGPGVTLTAGALHDAGLRIGKDYRFTVIGMDQDGPAKARAFIENDLRGLDAIARSITLLTGDKPTVAAAEHALGFHAVYDATNDQFAHDAASFIFTPDGSLSRILPETAATPLMLRGAIAAAARGDVTLPRPGVIGQIIAVCYGFAAAHGVYGQAIVLALRTLGVATLALLAFSLWRLTRRRRAT